MLITPFQRRSHESMRALALCVGSAQRQISELEHAQALAKFPRKFVHCLLVYASLVRDRFVGGVIVC
jgi:hypothetical protein